MIPRRLKRCQRIQDGKQCLFYIFRIRGQKFSGSIAKIDIVCPYGISIGGFPDEV
uniref:hypothetical protein n=1 Tax=Clostridium sp. NkU-1 TaxID=1095009 RepID=UPI0032617C21